MIKNNHNIQYFAQVFGLIPHSNTSIAVATFIQSLAPLNSAANPIIYCLFSADPGKLLRFGLKYDHILLLAVRLHYFRPCARVCPCLNSDNGDQVTSSGQTNSSSLLTSSTSNSHRQVHMINNM